MSGVLVDTSVWIDHFRHRNLELERLLNQEQALIHPMVIGEIACGTPPAPRARTLADLSLLPSVQQIGLGEVMVFIERDSLYGTGCGLIDLVLLASTRITPGAKIWTLDRRLGELAERFDVAHRIVIH